MFVRLAMPAHKALKHYMMENPSLGPLTLRRIYGAIAEAELDEGFADELDFLCADAFVGQMSEGYDDLGRLFSEPTDELYLLLRRHGIIGEMEDDWETEGED